MSLISVIATKFMNLPLLSKQYQSCTTYLDLYSLLTYWDLNLWTISLIKLKYLSACIKLTLLYFVCLVVGHWQHISYILYWLQQAQQLSMTIARQCVIMRNISEEMYIPYICMHPACSVWMSEDLGRSGYKAAHTGVRTGTNVVMPPSLQGTISEPIWYIYLEPG